VLRCFSSPRRKDLALIAGALPLPGMGPDHPDCGQQQRNQHHDHGNDNQQLN